MKQEEKAKRYDEASKWMEGIYPTLTHEQQMEAEAFFPELKESEDERIRKALISVLKSDFENDTTIHDISVGDIIAWLEKKQSKHNMGISETTKQELEDNLNKSLEKETSESWNEFLEKQGEQKKTLCNKCKKQQPSHSCQDITALGRCAIEHEQKYANKVEPKFKNGQWIVWQDKCYKVNYNGCGYELVDKNGLSTSLEYGTIDRNAHIWDITKDAKDGDVLAVTMYPEVTWIGIFKEHNGCTFSSHCSLNTEGKFKLGMRGHGCGKAIHPATKEQRDLLFQKMHEAGHEWDAKKLELKKVEPKKPYVKPTTYEDLSQI